MAELVEPSPGEAESLPLSGALKYAFGDGWIVPAGTDLYASDTGATGAPLDAFDIANASTSSFDVDIQAGEAFVEGKYLWKDTTTTVTVPSSDTVTIYVAWPGASGNDVRIDHPGGSDYPSGPHGALPVWTIETDGSGVIDTTDERAIGDPSANVIGGDLDVQGGVFALDRLQAADSSGDFGSLNFLNNREFSGLQGHFITTVSPHLPFVIRQEATNAIVVSGGGHVDVPNGDLDVGGVLSSDGRHAVTEDVAWDGNEMIIRTEGGTRIRFTAE